MKDTIYRQDAIDALDCINGTEEVLRSLPSAQPEKCTEERAETHACDCISRQAAIECLEHLSACDEPFVEIGIDDETFIGKYEAITEISDLPSAQPFHNITMNDVLKYIDGMPEDVWQEFTACLECRGWELKRITTKWCGSEFA